MRWTSVLTIFSILLVTLIFTGCGCNCKCPNSVNANKYIKHKRYTKKRNLSSKYAKYNLKKHYRRYRGIKYCYGGVTKKCFDCSGFVVHTYKKLFNIKLSRTARSQVRQGRWISKRKLRAGDLIFFKPRRVVNHVGIYIGNGNFIHASSSKGVTKSNLRDYYWRDHYYTGRRFF